jgi:hypothetical protein
MSAKQQQPDDEPKRDPSLCAAKGCPMRWSCDMGNGKLCSWHDRAPPHAWPQIAAELQRTLRDGSTPLMPKPARMPSLPHPGCGMDDGLHWARSLRHRESQGERLTLFQREAWHKGLKASTP